MKGREKFAAILATILLAQPTLALAQDGTAVDTLIVTARRDPEDPPVVADARRRLSETPGAVAVVAAETYENRLAVSLADALRDAPGVYAQKKWGEDIRLSIRGSGIGNNNHNRGTLLAQDGVPFNEADGYGDFQMIDPLIARYTEVYRGGNALRFGGALLGGAINLVTPTGHTAGATNRVRLDGGAYRTARLHAEAARVRGDSDLFAAATVMTADGWRAQSAQSAARLSLNLGHALGEDREVRFILSAGDIVQEIPGALTLAQALTTPKAAAATNLPAGLNSHRNMQSARGALQTRWRVSASTVLEAGAYAVWKDLYHPIFQVLDQQSRNYGAFGRLDWTGELGGRTADAYLGAWLRDGALSDDRFVNLRGSRGARTLNADHRATALDIFAEGRLFVTDRLALVGGAGLGRAERDFRNRLNPALDNSRIYDWVSPRIGLLWQSADGAQVFANLTRSVEPPNMAALAQNSGAFAALKAQDAWTAEVGTRGRRGAFTWDVAAYQARLDNELLTFTPGPNIPAASFNAGRTIHTGLEAALDWRMTGRLRLRQTYMWSNFRFDGDPAYGDDRLPIVPEHLYRAELKYQHPSGWFVAPSVEWAAKAGVDYANTQTSPAYAVMSLNGGLTVREGVTLFLDARNLTDEAYVSNVNAVVLGAGAVFWPGEGRSLFAGLTAAF